MKKKTTAVAKRRATLPKKEDTVQQLKSKLQFHMLQSAHRYIALQQINRGINRLNRKLDRARAEVVKRDVAIQRLTETAKQLAMGNRPQLTGADQIQSIIHAMLSGQVRVIRVPQELQDAANAAAKAMQREG